VDSTDTLVLNYGADWPNTHIDGKCFFPRGVPAYGSSAALKKDIRAMSSAEAVAIVDALDPVTFRWKHDDAKRHLGFIAEKCPDAVTTAERNGVFVLDIVAALTRVVRDQAKTITALERRIDKVSAEPA
jgi:hypothetical protein